jgi:hypothetical protein
MLAATLLALGAAGSVAAATETCFPLQHFQWAPAGAGAGYLGVTLTNPGIDPWVVDGEIAFA